jgi:signal transduction histidine kinase
MSATAAAAAAHTEPAAPRCLRVLHLEDSEPDHQLALAHLRRRGLIVEATRLETRAEFQAALAGDEALRWDAIVSDYNLPGFTGVEALHMVRALGLVLPFILVSGEIGEEIAVNAMRNGASDYLLKDNLARLAPALEHAIEAAEAQRARRSADRELLLSRQRLSELAQHLQTRVEQERAAIAREIHDDVGGSLTALKFELDWIRRHSEAADVLQRVALAQETLNLAIEASQRVMHNLRPAILEQGLVAALQWMSNRFTRRTGTECLFTTSHERPELPAGVPLVAYRTAQEALTNVSKHAQASAVRMDLSLSANVLLLEVADDGRGLEPGALEKSRSFGLRGLRERAAMVGGWIDLASGPSGTTLILSVPLQPGAGIEEEAEPPDAGDTLADHDPSAWEVA